MWPIRFAMQMWFRTKTARGSHLEVHSIKRSLLFLQWTSNKIWWFKGAIEHQICLIKEMYAFEYGKNEHIKGNRRGKIDLAHPLILPSCNFVSTDSTYQYLSHQWGSFIIIYFLVSLQDCSILPSYTLSNITLAAVFSKFCMHRTPPVKLHCILWLL